MTGRFLIGGRSSGRSIAALIAVAHLEIVRAVIEARKQAELEVARTKVLAGAVPGSATRLIDVLQQGVVEPAVAKPKFGSNRPYLKKKKGRS